MFKKGKSNVQVDPSLHCLHTTDRPFSRHTIYTVITLNIGTPRPATVVVLNIKQFNFTLK